MSIRDEGPKTARSRTLGDQAEGLRRLFQRPQTLFLPLVSNPFVEGGAVAVEQWASALAAQGLRVVVVDAAESSPPAPDAVALGLGAALEKLSDFIAYLPARGLIRTYVDAQGSASSLLDALLAAVPKADAFLIHAPAVEVSRLFTGRLERPVLIGGERADSVKHAYAALKLLSQRLGWRSFDLAMVARPSFSRSLPIARNLAAAADQFLGAVLKDWCQLSAKGTAREPLDARLRALVAERVREARRPAEASPVWAPVTPSSIPRHAH